jgi:hypothetical protein
MNFLRRLYYRLFTAYKRLEIRRCSWAEGDALIRDTFNLAEPLQWQLALPEEDKNHAFDVVFLERKVRIRE